VSTTTAAMSLFSMRRLGVSEEYADPPMRRIGPGACRIIRVLCVGACGAVGLPGYSRTMRWGNAMWNAMRPL